MSTLTGTKETITDALAKQTAVLAYGGWRTVAARMCALLRFLFGHECTPRIHLTCVDASPVRNLIFQWMAFLSKIQGELNNKVRLTFHVPPAFFFTLTYPKKDNKASGHQGELKMVHLLRRLVFGALALGCSLTWGQPSFPVDTGRGVVEVVLLAQLPHVLALFALRSLVRSHQTA